MITNMFYGYFEVSDTSGKKFKRIPYENIPSSTIENVRKTIEDFRITRRGRTYGVGNIIFAPYTENTASIICNKYVPYSKLHNFCMRAVYKDDDGRIYRYNLYSKDINKQLEHNFIKSVSNFYYAIKKGVLDDLKAYDSPHYENSSEEDED